MPHANHMLHASHIPVTIMSHARYIHITDAYVRCVGIPQYCDGEGVCVHSPIQSNTSKTVEDQTVKAEDVQKVMKEIRDIRTKHDQNASLIHGILK